MNNIWPINYHIKEIRLRFPLPICISWKEWQRGLHFSIRATVASWASSPETVFTFQLQSATFRPTRRIRLEFSFLFTGQRFFVSTLRSVLTCLWSLCLFWWWFPYWWLLIFTWFVRQYVPSYIAKAFYAGTFHWFCEKAIGYLLQAGR